MAKKAANERQNCPHCSLCLRVKNLENHFLCSHKQKYLYLFCQICCSTFREECVDDHIRFHNNRGHGLKFLRKEKLLELSGTPWEKMSKFMRLVKSHLDFEYRQTLVLENMSEVINCVRYVTKTFEHIQ